MGVYCSGLGWTIDSKLDDYKTYEYFEENNLHAFLIEQIKDFEEFDKENEQIKNQALEIIDKACKCCIAVVVIP